MNGILEAVGAAGLENKAIVFVTGHLDLRSHERGADFLFFVH